MANLAFNDLWQVRAVAYDDEQAAVNTFHFRVAAITGTGPSDVAFADAMDTLLSFHYKGIIASGARWRGVSVQRVWPTPKTFPITDISNDSDGQVVSDRLPRQTAGILRLQTEKAGQKYRGRVYLPFPAEADNIAPGKPTGDYQLRVGGLASALTPDITIGQAPNDATVQLVIWHRNDAFQPSSDRVTRLTSRPFWATQRRRGDYGQRNRVPF